MKKTLNMFKSVMALVFAITLLACDNNYQIKKKMGLSDNVPMAEGRNINFKYTDSGKLVTNLLAEKLLDYSNLKFPYKEFPKGVEVHFWDEKGEENTVTANYAIQYEKTGLIDLRENVVVVTSDSVILKSDQLYWDQKNAWVFTDRPYEIRFKDGSYNRGAVGFDSNQDFTIFLSRKNLGVQLVDKTKTQDVK
ncbi:MAG: LPS export ABC transporter periplasmic protein LptC [Aequorivita sp.]